MKGLRSFLLLLVAAAALGGYLYYDSKHEPSDEKKQDKAFADLQSDKIDQVTIKSAKGEATTAAKQGDKWQETKPASVPADEAEVSGITTNLASLSVSRVIDEQPSDYKQYGLEPARIEVRFRSGGQERALLLGQKTPTGTDLYARLPDKPRVFLVPSYVETTFDKSPFDLRDKTILKIDRDKVDGVTIDAAGRTITVAKQGVDWRLTAPIGARADFSAIEGLIGRLNSTQMKAIASNDADANALKEFGLDKPAATVHVTSGSAQAALAIGKSAGDGIVYARDLARPMVFTVESALADELKKPIDDFRLKDLFDARAFNTTRIEIVRGAQTLAYEKDKDTWKQVTPLAKPADGAKLDALITALTNARATGFVDSAPALDAPEMTAALKFDEGKQEKVAFARQGTDAFARRDGDKGAAKIDASALDAIAKALDALK
ncbi:MAG TPA: DUF4340 domain-containing protein [Vicinamibacterales bacterium]